MNNRKSLSELVEITKNLARKIGRTPSRKQIEEAMGTDYAYYGYNISEFQEHCGLRPNKPGNDQKIQDEELLKDLYDTYLREGEIPHQIRLRKWIRDGKIKHHTLESRFNGMFGIQKALHQYAVNKGDANILSMPGWKISFDDVGSDNSTIDRIRYVYLMRHGNRNEYKIGKTYNPIKREGQIRLELPNAVEPIHYIETDDPSGIELYWHRRFGDKNTNGEWFILSQNDVNSFKKWKKII